MFFLSKKCWNVWSRKSTFGRETESWYKSRYILYAAINQFKKIRRNLIRREEIKLPAATAVNISGNTLSHQRLTKIK